MNAELRFTKHIKKYVNNSLSELKILKILCSTYTGANPRTLKATYITLIQLTMEYAVVIWSHTLKSTIEKNDNIQARTAQIIIGTISSTNSLRSQQECGLKFSTENRRKYNRIKFTDKL